MADAITHRFINSCRYVIFAEKSIKFDQIINKYNLLVQQINGTTDKWLVLMEKLNMLDNIIK